MTPKPITLQIAAPSRALPDGAVAQAFYIEENGKITLTDRDGRALHDHNGKDYSRTVAENDSAHQIAALLLRQLRTTVRGDRVSGFDGPLTYPRFGKI